MRTTATTIDGIDSTQIVASFSLLILRSCVVFVFKEFYFY